ncbi:hypothetical protein NL676_015766 [Syzygium grande]|nr:hypothetical protein NL676_015766 [Syzygium grande]
MWGYVTAMSAEHRGRGLVAAQPRGPFPATLLPPDSDGLPPRPAVAAAAAAAKSNFAFCFPPLFFSFFFFVGSCLTVWVICLTREAFSQLANLLSCVTCCAEKTERERMT